MMGFGYGMGIGGWIAMVIFLVALIALVVWVLSRVISVGGNPGAHDSHENAEDVLARRFVAGEIDEATFRSMRDALRANRSTRESG